MRVLVACEYSGTVRDAFADLGHDAWSCDLLPSETPGKHYQGDIFHMLCSWQFSSGFDLIIAHPPCTYLTNSGVRWLHTEPGRWEKMKNGAAFFKSFLYANADMICIENPIPHKYALKEIGVKYDQIIQPWQFGHGETKATCLWLKNLPKLRPTNIVPGREQRVWRMPPGPDRWKERSRTYKGIAQAMADQFTLKQNIHQQELFQ